MKTIKQILSLEMVLWDISRLQNAASAALKSSSLSTAKSAAAAVLELETLHHRVDEVRQAMIAELSALELAELEAQRHDMRA